MFGTILIDQKKLDKKFLQGYRAAYCGLCQSLSKTYGKLGEKTLSYDLTFLVLLLESVDKNPIKVEQVNCTMHPFRKISYFTDTYCDYAADMNFYLAYLKVLDDIRDEHKTSLVKKKESMLPFVQQLSEKYPEKIAKIDCYMEQLTMYEVEQEIDPELPTDCFGRVMEAVFDYPGEYQGMFRKVGYHMGRYVYLVDAMVDFDDDLKQELYNPLVSMRKDSYQAILENEVKEMSDILSGVSLVHHKEIMDNILYSGLGIKYEARFGGKIG